MMTLKFRRQVGSPSSLTINIPGDQVSLRGGCIKGDDGKSAAYETVLGKFIVATEATKQKARLWDEVEITMGDEG